MPKAVQYERWGSPDVLEVVEVPEIHAGEGQVRLAVKAAGLNPFDFKIRSGKVPLADPKFPRGIGSDAAGIVDEVGPGATYTDGSPIQVGDEVLGWAEKAVRQQLVVGADKVVRKPAEVPWEVAGALSTAAQTAYAAIDTLNPGPDDTILLSAAAGSVGVLFAQLAIARGAKVIGTASAANADYLASFGIVPTTYGPGLADRVRALAPHGITMVEDHFGREAIDAGLELGVPPERINTIVEAGAREELGLAPFAYNRKAAVLERAVADVAAGVLRLPIDQTYPIDLVRDAFELLESRHLTGKVVILP